MEISKLLFKTSSLTMDLLFKASRADIRLHGIEGVPEQPVLFVVNHFTRIETTFLPYLLKKHTGRYSLSLADASFFSGKFGAMLEKLGAISTDHPDRDRILTRALLTGEHSVIIFPEGQMIKDKKLVEKGKYMVYNAGIKRPPHTGSARLALLAQYYREKLSFLSINGFTDEYESLRDHFKLTDDEAMALMQKETFIVPVNITYYPIRAKNNAMNKIADFFSGTLSERYEEELQVEGTMLIDGVDIDINFGDPIQVKEYLHSSSRTVKSINTASTGLDRHELKKTTRLKKQGIDLMYAYMRSIYEMTTVNHDHIFSYILSTVPLRKIDETDFKNRANMAIEKIRELGLSNFHSTLKKKQGYLRTDDFHEKYDSFIEAVRSDGLIYLSNGYIIKNMERFNRPYTFHTVRKDNIAEVLKNEVEPMRGIIRTLNMLMLYPPSMVRRSIRRVYIKKDLAIFRRDYLDHFIPEETKPEQIGRPFFLKTLRKKRGVILVHGYMAAPEEIRVLAEHLNRAGYCVYGVRLRGHGTSPEDLASRTWDEWYESVNRGYIIMKNTVDEFAIAGFSTGAGLALMQAANKNEKFRAVISISAPLRLQSISSRFASAVVVWNTLLKKIHVQAGKMEFAVNDPENPHINYLRNPISGVRELEKMMSALEERLGDIRIPSLVIQGSEDPVVNPESAGEIFDSIGTGYREINKIYSTRHGIVRGDTAERVAARVINFLNEVFND